MKQYNWALGLSLRQRNSTTHRTTRRTGTQYKEPFLVDFRFEMAVSRIYNTTEELSRISPVIDEMTEIKCGPIDSDGRSPQVQGSNNSSK